jgi:hypothetical protein
MGNIATILVPYLLAVANRNDPVCVTSPKVAKASKMSVAVTNIFAKMCCQCTRAFEGSLLSVLDKIAVKSIELRKGPFDVHQLGPKSRHHFNG